VARGKGFEGMEVWELALGCFGLKEVIEDEEAMGPIVEGRMCVVERGGREGNR
jgi:hypothetical protein